jgi:hypothetical protein
MKNVVEAKKFEDITIEKAKELLNSEEYKLKLFDNLPYMTYDFLIYSEQILKNSEPLYRLRITYEYLADLFDLQSVVYSEFQKLQSENTRIARQIINTIANQLIEKKENVNGS